MSSATVEKSLKRIEARRDLLVSGQGKVAPGQPLAFTLAAVPGVDAIAQGDLVLIAAESVPKGYTLRKGGDGQLVPGNTTGSKHVIVDVRACEIYDPPGFGPTYDSLQGPYIVAKRETEVGHPTHGNVTVPPGMTIECQYDKVLDQETKKERRQRD